MNASESGAATAAELLAEIERDLSFAVATWRVYEETHGADGAVVAQAIAPGFFGLLGIILPRDVCLAIRRLTDPPRGGRRGRFGNASLATLIAASERASNEDRLALESALNDLRERAAPVELYCDKYLAHLDVDHALNRRPLPPINRTTIFGALGDASEIVRRIAEIETPDRVPDPFFADVPRGGSELVRVLLAASGGGEADSFRVSLVLAGVENVSTADLLRRLQEAAPEVGTVVSANADASLFYVTMTVVSTTAIGAAVECQALLDAALTVPVSTRTVVSVEAAVAGEAGSPRPN